ncbi:MAG: aminotransferase class V-fold PLP-dependent enzyme [Peptococcaceae bacterium]|nr:aminotransferase class V-fold PLP-dependent enzyme [Peptococcaceae bacterium]
MIYLDNAATTWPKPKEVKEAMCLAMDDYAFNPGRGRYRGALSTSGKVQHTRDLLAQLFGIADSHRIVFTVNATMAINMALQGMLNPGDHVITTSIEHNAVWRPLKYLQRRGVELTVINCELDGTIDAEQIRLALRTNTKLIVSTHASNVLGTIEPIAAIGKIAREHNVAYLVDAAQTAGVIPINVEEMCIDLLAFPGHKGLLGPQGTGGLYVGPRVNPQPLLQGGTGNNSEQDYQPEAFPEKLESGTLNTVGIVGLGAGIEHLLATGIDNIYTYELNLCKLLVKGLRQIENVQIYGVDDWQARVPLVSLNLGKHNSNEVGYILDRIYQIWVRTGLHCAPQAHRTMHTLEQGCIRVSPSNFTTQSEIESFVQAIEEINEELRG